MSSTTEAVSRRKAKREMAENIKLLLETPMGSGPVTDIEDVNSLQELTDCNVTVSTRILMKKAVAAMKGDDKAAQFLFEYGGFKPVEEKHVSIETPMFIDDLTSMDMRPPFLRPAEKDMIDVTPEPKAVPMPTVHPSDDEPKAVPMPTVHPSDDEPKPVPFPVYPEPAPKRITHPTRTIHANPLMGAQVTSRPSSQADLPDWIDSI